MYPLDDAFFSAIDSDLKAYALGWIASDAAIQRGTITLFIHRNDVEILTALRDAICPDLPIRPQKDTPLIGLTLSSEQMVSDVCRWLEITPGKEDSVVGFPQLANDALKWAFTRGYFDGDGSVDSPRERSAGTMPYPRCKIASTSTKLLEAMESFCAIPCHRGRGHIEWAGNNALDFLSRIYDGAPIALLRKRALYEDWSTWVPGLTGHHGRDVLFRWVKTLPAARPPTKAHASDSGYDITLIEPGRRVGAVQFYRTGLKIQPSFGWYFDLVPRSSITKTGYILANSVGVIDRTYVGEILVPLIKVDPKAPELELPARVAQVIPRPIVHAEFVEVESLDESLRGSGGFGSTGHR
jgi:dUTP pyrophosphatase